MNEEIERLKLQRGLDFATSCPCATIDESDELEATEELKNIPGLVGKVRKRYKALIKAGLIEEEAK